MLQHYWQDIVIRWFWFHIAVPCLLLATLRKSQNMSGAYLMLILKLMLRNTKPIITISWVGNWVGIWILANVVVVPFPYWFLTVSIGHESTLDYLIIFENISKLDGSCFVDRQQSQKLLFSPFGPKNVTHALTIRTGQKAPSFICFDLWYPRALLAGSKSSNFVFMLWMPAACLAHMVEDFLLCCPEIGFT